MILDVARELGELLDDQATLVVLDDEPLIWEMEHLYVYPPRYEEVIFETGPTRRQNFTLTCVYVTASGDEARLERDPELAASLAAKRDQYMRVVREHYHLPATDSVLLRATVDTTRPRMLDKRSAAVRVDGWRIVN